MTLPLDSHHPHPVVVAVGHEDVALGVYAAAVGPVQPSLDSVASVTLVTLAAAGDGGDQTGGGVDAADGVVFRVHHDQVVMGVATYGLGRAPGGG